MKQSQKPDDAHKDSPFLHLWCQRRTTATGQNGDWRKCIAKCQERRMSTPKPDML